MTGARRNREENMHAAISFEHGEQTMPHSKQAFLLLETPGHHAFRFVKIYSFAIPTHDPLPASFVHLLPSS